MAFNPARRLLASLGESNHSEEKKIVGGILIFRITHDLKIAPAKNRPVSMPVQPDFP